MAKYVVYVKSSAFGFATVEADTPEQAIKLVVEDHEWDDLDLQAEWDRVEYNDCVETEDGEECHVGKSDTVASDD